MLPTFLAANQAEILAATESKTLNLAGVRASSVELKKGLPIFFQQMLKILILRRPRKPLSHNDQTGATEGAANSDEVAMPLAVGQPEEAELAKSAGLHGAELLRLGYTLSHVVHAYGAMCQSITELAIKKHFQMSTKEFRDLNQCLDIAIAGAVTQFQSLKNTQESNRENEHLGSLAHEMRNAITSVSISFQMIQNGMVGTNGRTGDLIVSSLKRLGEIIDRSLTEVRLRIDPAVQIESCHLTQLVDQILVSARVEAQERDQTIEVQIGSDLIVEADQQAFHSTLSNVIQNAIKYSVSGSKIEIRGKIIKDQVVIEVEDQCGGLLGNKASDLFKPFVQRNENRSGMGLGLTIAKRAIELNQGKLEVRNLEGVGCIFTISLPKPRDQMTLAPSAA
jgi:signal transduction histidine kinase